MEFEERPSMEDEDTQYRFVLEPSSFTIPLMRILQDSLDNASLALQAVDAFQTDTKPQLPTTMPIGIFGVPREELSTPDHDLSIDHAELAGLKREFRWWLLRTAFSEFIKAVSISLQQAYVYLELNKLGQKGLVRSDEMSATMEAARTKAQKFDIPTLVKSVSDRLTAPLALADIIVSINRVRNCLEHRLGVVQEADVKNTDGELTMKWQRVRPIYIKDGQKFEVKLNERIYGPAVLDIEAIECSKTFKLGESIEVSVDEFNQVMFCCSLLAMDIRQKIPPLPGDRDFSTRMGPTSDDGGKS
jgi:hypothetical protein